MINNQLNDVPGNNGESRVQVEQPGRFPDAQLRTLQRRVKSWRHVMVRGLVFGGQNASELSAEAAPIGLDKAPILQ